MNTDILVSQYPRLYHMAAPGSWASILRHGLFSTTALLDLFEYSGNHRRQIEECHRPEIVEISHKKYGTASIRDQKPMSDNGLLRCLRGVRPTDWYKLLNSKVFFWATEERLTRLLGAAAYRTHEHDVLIIDANELVRRHEQRITLSPMNTGCTKPFPHPRGPDAFQSISDYPYDAWKKTRGRQGDPLVEVAVEYSVPDIGDVTLKVERRKGNQIIDVIWSSEG